jgi:GxxExxY protein
MDQGRADLKALTEAIIGAAIEVHRHLGPGLLESTYRRCLAHELTLRGLNVEVEKELPVDYKGVRIDCGYRIDMRVNGLVLLELKAVEKFHPIHEAQLLSYMKLSGCKVGLLINFNVRLLTEGVKRIVNALDE